MEGNGRGITQAGVFYATQLATDALLTAIRYSHAVTKARNRTLASETGGGILADEMEMGKSLSSLALITKTLDKAYDWVMEKKANPEDYKRQTACRATLVLVPSASKSNYPFNSFMTTVNTVPSTHQQVVQRNRLVRLDHGSMSL